MYQKRNDISEDGAVVRLKTCATILLALYVFSYLALSAELNDLNDDLIDEIGNKLGANDKLKFSATSPTTRQIVRVFPQDVLARVVNAHVRCVLGQASYKYLFDMRNERA